MVVFMFSVFSGYFVLLVSLCCPVVSQGKTLTSAEKHSCPPLVVRQIYIYFEHVLETNLLTMPFLNQHKQPLCSLNKGERKTVC